jgi:cytochrome c peroxidase
MRRTWIGLGAALLLAACGTDRPDVASSAQAIGGGGAMDGGGGGGMGGGGGGMGGGGQLAMLGRMIFFDTNLSAPPGQSCASCHDPETGFTGPDSEVNATTAVYPGAASQPGSPKFGNRKPPSAAYATPSPKLHFEYDPVEEEGLFVGGLFFDGRATGWRLDSPAAEQALGPFLNPVEQALPTAEQVVRTICEGMYAQMFKRAYGNQACAFPSQDVAAEVRDAWVAAAYDKVGLAVAAFEASPFVNRYSSKYDRYLRGEAKLTSLERRGLDLFNGKAQCALCHPSTPGEDGAPPLFTDNTFDNLGLPRNPNNPFYAVAGNDWRDPGLGGFLDTLTSDPDPELEYSAMAKANLGKHRVPTLRNVDKRPYPGFVKSYGHNGVFTSLKQIVHFYNTRDALRRCDEVPRALPGANCWPAPEIGDNVNDDELGDLGLSDKEEEAVVAFLATLSDS